MNTRQTQIVNAASMSIIDGALNPEELKRQIELIQRHMRGNMKEGEHFGTIPGCGNKPALLKPGAEKLCMIFGFAPEFEITMRQDGHHREYEVKCRLIHRGSGILVSEGSGCCSTMEGKYRFRAGAKELTGIEVPKTYWDLRKSDPDEAMKSLQKLANSNGIEGSKFGTAKNENGTWVITTAGERTEHDNPADYYNTVLKMAKKRAFVDAVITGTAAGDIFTQDVEENPELYGGAKPQTSAKATERHNQHQQERDVTPAPSPARPHNPANFDNDEQGHDQGNWRDVKIHFGQKLKGVALGDLNSHNLKWFQNEWLAASKTKNRLSNDDRKLMQAVQDSIDEEAGNTPENQNHNQINTATNDSEIADEDLDF